MNKDKVEGQYIFYYRNGHLCRFNLDKDNGIFDRKRALAKRRAEKAKQKVTGITAEPTRIVRNKNGKITFDDGFKKEDRLDEIKVGAIIKNKFHKDVHHLKEGTDKGVKNPDLLVDGKYSEIKTSYGVNIDSLLRKSLKQVNVKGGENAGDVYLNLRKTKMHKKEADKQIRYRLSRSIKSNQTKVIAIWNDESKTYRKK